MLGKYYNGKKIVCVSGLMIFLEDGTTVNTTQIPNSVFQNPKQKKTLASKKEEIKTETVQNTTNKKTVEKKPFVKSTTKPKVEKKITEEEEFVKNMQFSGIKKI